MKDSGAKGRGGRWRPILLSGASFLLAVVFYVWSEPPISPGRWVLIVMCVGLALAPALLGAIASSLGSGLLLAAGVSGLLGSWSLAQVGLIAAVGIALLFLRGPGRSPWSPFERMTEGTAEIFGRARFHCSEWKHDFISTEHILMALIATGRGHRYFHALGIARDEIETSLRRAVVHGTATIERGMLAFTPAAKRLLDRSAASADDRRSASIEPYDLLVGLAQEEELAGKVLREHGVTPERLAGIAPTG